MNFITVEQAYLVLKHREQSCIEQVNYREFDKQRTMMINDEPSIR